MCEFYGMARPLERRHTKKPGANGDHVASEFSAKKAIMNQSANFDAGGLIFAQASRITMLA
jgi:hypothetical protein